MKLFEQLYVVVDNDDEVVLGDLDGPLIAESYEEAECMLNSLVLPADVYTIKPCIITDIV